MINVTLQNVLTGHAEPIYTLKKKDNDIFYSGSGDGFVGKWSIKNGSFDQPVAKCGNTIYSIADIPNKKMLLIGLQNGVLNIIDSEQKSIIKKLKLFENGIFDIVYRPKHHQIILASGDGNLGIVDATTFTLQNTVHLSKKSLRCLSLSPCGNFLVVGASDHYLYFLDITNDVKIKQILPAHKNSIFTAVYKDPYTLLTGGRDAHLKEWIWQEESKEWIIKQSIPAHNYTLNKIAIQPKKALIATSSRDKTIKIWNYSTLELIKVISLEKFEGGHTHSINTLLWLDDNTLLSTGDDKRIISWNITE